MHDAIVDAPWDLEQVQSLWAYQRSKAQHPFTCPAHSDAPLVPTAIGWVCTINDCDYEQSWAYASMLTYRGRPVDTMKVLIDVQMVVTGENDAEFDKAYDDLMDLISSAANTFREDYPDVYVEINGVS